MKYYAQIGMSEVVVDETTNPICPTGHIEMLSDRPDGDYVANADGTWVVRKKTAEEIRAERDSKLAASDKYLLMDFPGAAEKMDAIMEYRKALREVPEQVGFPKKVDWPTDPMA